MQMLKWSLGYDFMNVIHCCNKISEATIEQWVKNVWMRWCTMLSCNAWGRAWKRENPWRIIEDRREK